MAKKTVKNTPVVQVDVADAAEKQIVNKTSPIVEKSAEIDDFIDEDEKLESEDEDFILNEDEEDEDEDEDEDDEEDEEDESENESEEDKDDANGETNPDMVGLNVNDILPEGSKRVRKAPIRFTDQLLQDRSVQKMYLEDVPEDELFAALEDEELDDDEESDDEEEDDEEEDSDEEEEDDEEESSEESEEEPKKKKTKK